MMRVSMRNSVIACVRVRVRVSIYDIVKVNVRVSVKVTFIVSVRVNVRVSVRIRLRLMFFLEIFDNKCRSLGIWKTFKKKIRIRFNNKLY